MTSPRIVLKCEPKNLEFAVSINWPEGTLQGKVMHDSVAAACYQQAIEEARPELSVDANQLLDHIEQRAADLLAEKLR